MGREQDAPAVPRAGLPWRRSRWHSRRRHRGDPRSSCEGRRQSVLAPDRAGRGQPVLGARSSTRSTPTITWSSSSRRGRLWPTRPEPPAPTENIGPAQRPAVAPARPSGPRVPRPGSTGKGHAVARIDRDATRRLRELRHAGVPGLGVVADRHARFAPVVEQVAADEVAGRGEHADRSPGLSGQVKDPGVEPVAAEVVAVVDEQVGRERLERAAFARYSRGLPETLINRPVMVRRSGVGLRPQSVSPVSTMGTSWACMATCAPCSCAGARRCRRGRRRRASGQ